MSLDINAAQAQLAALTNGNYTEDDLLLLARQVDVTAEGSVTVLYSGSVDGVKTSTLATNMANDPDVNRL